MKLAHLCAAMALGLAAFFAPAAAAQHTIDPDYVHAGAERVVLEDPSTEPARAFERAELTQYRNDQVDGGSVLGWGDLLADFLQGLLAAAGVFALYLLRRLPETAVKALDAFAGMLNQGRANELIEKAVAYGINVTAGAVRGKTLDFKVGSSVLERATDYALDKAPLFVRMVLGGSDKLRQMIAARLDLGEDVALPLAKPPADAAFVSAAAPAAAGDRAGAAS